MLYSNELIFLHLQKTGGNHVEKLLARHFDLQKHGKHTGIVGDIMRPTVMIGIRNPWDWYVSLWAYGCQNEGALWSYLTADRATCVRKLFRLHSLRPGSWGLAMRHLAALPKKAAGTWRAYYRNPDDAEAFRLWLNALHHAPTVRQTGEDFSALPLAKTCGLMTARYLEVISREQDWRAHRAKIATVPDAIAYRERYSAATTFIRTETLEQDLSDALRQMGVDAPAETLRTARTNPSSHRTADYYYNSDTRQLVAERDRAVIDAHGYSFPG